MGSIALPGYLAIPAEGVNALQPCSPMLMQRELPLMTQGKTTTDRLLHQRGFLNILLLVVARYSLFWFSKMLS